MCYDEEYFLERNLYPWLDDPPDPSEVDEYPREFEADDAGRSCPECDHPFTEGDDATDVVP